MRILLLWSWPRSVRLGGLGTAHPQPFFCLYDCCRISVRLRILSAVSFHPHNLQSPRVEQQAIMEFLTKHLDCLSNFQLNLQPGWQTVGASALLAAGSLFVVSRALVFVRVLLSLFVLPGKPVCCPSQYQLKTMSLIFILSAPLLRP